VPQLRGFIGHRACENLVEADAPLVPKPLPFAESPADAPSVHSAERVIRTPDATRCEPGSVKVIESPHEAFTREAVSYLRRAVFRPARIGGRAVRVCVEVPVDFRIRSY